MRTFAVLIVVVFGGWALGSARGADITSACKDDPRLVERCRWVTGVVAADVGGTMHLDIRNERSFVLADEDSLDVILNLPGRFKAGEFEFCRFKDKTIDQVVDADGTTAPYPQAWGCVSAARNTIPEPDFKTDCLYAPSRGCESEKPKP